MSEKYKKALRIAVNVGCGFEGDAEDAAELLTLITGLESRIAELKGVIEILEDQRREAKNILIDKNLHIDSLYEEGYKLQQRIAELQAAQRWIPVSERLPELRVGRVDLVYTVYGEIHSAMYLGNGWTSLYRDFRSNEVTHWMPLPESPNDTQTDTVVYG